MSSKEKIKGLIRRAGKDFALGWHLPSLYRSAVQQPIEEGKIIFLETEWDYLPEAFGQVKKQLEQAKGVWCVEHLLHKHSVSGRAYLKNCEAFVQDAATAQVVFLCEASDVVSCLPLREETKVVQLWHGCGAFKRWGYSAAEYEFGQTRAQIDKRPGYKNLSLVTVSSPEVVWAYEEAMGLKDQSIVQPIGVSRSDVFFDEAFLAGAKQSVLAAVPQAAGKSIVLYAPTFRGDKVAHAHIPPLPNFKLLQNCLGSNSVVLVKQHPHVSTSTLDACTENGFVADVSDIPIDVLLAAADVLVTDYSSVIFEYSLLGRPMVFFALDLEEYEAERSFFYDYAGFVPGPIARTNEQLADLLASTETWFSPGQVQDFKNKFMSACDGHATQRILEVVGLAK